MLIKKKERKKHVVNCIILVGSFINFFLFFYKLSGTYVNGIYINTINNEKDAQRSSECSARPECLREILLSFTFNKSIDMMIFHLTFILFIL